LRSPPIIKILRLFSRVITNLIVIILKNNPTKTVIDMEQYPLYAPIL
jgi:hypothetical protein